MTVRKIARGALSLIDPDEDLPSGHLSASAVSMYQRCPRQFEFRYVHGIKSPPSVALVEGLAHHDWLRVHNQGRVRSQERLRGDEAMDLFTDFWRAGKGEASDHSMAADRDVPARAQRLIDAYLRGPDQKLEPTSAEEKVQLVLGGVPVLGFIDVMTEDAVLDYKVVGKKKSKSDVENSLQMAIYAAAKPRAKRVGMMSFVKPSAKIVTEEARVNKAMVSWAGEVVASVAGAVKASAFPCCAPDSWVCSERFCGYWDRCRGKKR